MPPVTNPAALIATAVGAVLSSGVALVAILVPGLDQIAQVAIIAFGNSVIGLGVAVYAVLNTTSNTAPVVQPDTTVTVKTSEGEPNRLVHLTSASGVPSTEGGPAA